MALKLIGSPNIGDSTIGSDTYCYGQFTCALSGTATHVYLWPHTNGYAKVAIFADNGANYPGARLAKQDTTTALTQHVWNTIALEASCVLVVGLKYWLCAIGSATGNITCNPTTGGTTKSGAATYSTFVWPDNAPGGMTVKTWLMSFQGWGTLTPITLSPSGIAQLIAAGTPKLTLVLSPTGISLPIAYGTPTVEIIIIPSYPAPIRKVLVTHPAIKAVTVVKDGETQVSYDNLSNLDELRIEDAIELPVSPPAKLLVETLSGEVFTFDIPP